MGRRQHQRQACNFSGTNLSFFKKFPALTLTLNDFSLTGSAPFQTDTLVSAKEISLAIDLSSVLKSKININKIYLNQALINIQVDSAGMQIIMCIRQRWQNKLTLLIPAAHH
jgi:uncharacterized protein involved in outer membrane biogenesis